MVEADGTPRFPETKTALRDRSHGKDFVDEKEKSAVYLIAH
jgi:hypothetical protein